MLLSYPLILWISTLGGLLGSLQFGYQLAVLNPSLHQALESLGLSQESKGFYGSFIVSSVLAGALLGSLKAGNLADQIGPKKATMLASIPFMLGTTVSSFAPNVWILVFARVLAGIGVGSSSVLVSRYLNEISPVKLRGFLGSCNQLFINFGILLAFALGLVYNRDDDAHVWSMEWWRGMLLIGNVPSIVQLAVMSVCPETPVWLLWNGLHLQASVSYRLLHGSVPEGVPIMQGHDQGADQQGQEALTLLSDGIESMHGDYSDRRAKDRPDEVGYKVLFEKKYRRIMLLASVIPVSQQLSGINIVILYGAEVMKLCGFSNPLVSNLILGVVNTAFTILSALILDRVGRKPVLVTSFFGMALSLVLLSAALSFNASIWAFISLLMYISFFGEGCGGVPWVYLAEILPDEIKGTAQALCTAVNWGANILVGASFSFLLNSMGHLAGVFGLYAFFCTISGIFCSSYMIETKRKSLHQVHQELMQLGSE